MQKDDSGHRMPTRDVFSLPGRSCVYRSSLRVRAGHTRTGDSEPVLNTFKPNPRGLAWKLLMGVLWLLLTWHVALAIPQVPARSVSGWLAMLVPPSVLGILLVLAAAAKREGNLLLSRTETTSDLKKRLALLPSLSVMAALLAASGFLLMERVGYFLAFPIMVSLLCLAGMLALSVVRPGVAVALFFAVYPILSYIHVEETYWSLRPASVWLVPVDLIDPSLLDSPLAPLAQMSPSVIFMGALAGGWMTGVLRGRIKLSRTPLDWPIVVFVSSYFVSSMLSNDVGVSASYFVEAVLAPVLLYYVVVHTVRSKTDLQLVLLAMLSSGFVSFMYHLHKLAAGGANPELLATSLLFGNANLAGGLLVLLLPIAIVLFAAEKQRSSVRVVALVGLLSCVAELFLGGARGAWMAALVEVALLLAFSRRVRAYSRAFVLPILGILAYLARGTVSRIVEDRLGFLVTREAPITLLERLAIWQEAVNLVREDPLSGIGPGTFRTVGVNYFFDGRRYPAADAHNILLSIGAEAGIAATLAFLVLSLVVLGKGLRDLRSLAPSNPRLCLFGMLVAIIGWWIAGLTTGAEFSHRHVLAGTPILWAMMGLIVATREVRHE